MSTGTTPWAQVRAEVVTDLDPVLLAQVRAEQQAHIDGHRLAERREALGLTQSDLAARMGVSKGRVSQIENGQSRGDGPSLATWPLSVAGWRSPRSSATTTCSCEAPTPAPPESMNESRELVVGRRG